MNVTCEGCESKFKVDEAKIRPTGSKVRCSKCRHVFTVYPPAAPEPEEELLILEEEAPPEKEAGAALAGVDERLEELLGEKPATAAEQGGPAGDDLSAELNLDDLLADIPPAAEKPSAEKEPSAEGLELELDLPGIEAEREPPSAPAEPVLPSTDELELDLADLSFLEEGKEEKPAKDEVAAKSAAGEDELELDLESFLEEGKPAAGREAAPAADSPLKEEAAAPPEDELDLSDLEAMLEGEGSVAAEAKKPSATEGIDLELDLASEIGGKPQNGDLEELDLAAIVEPPEKGEAPLQADEKPSAKTEELDFSDLEAILEGEGQAAPAEETKAAGGQLLFGEEKETAPVAALPEDEETLDLEKLLAEEEDKAPMQPAEKAEKEEPEDLDLDLFLEPAAEKKDEAEPELLIEPLAEEEEPKAKAATAGLAATAAGAAAVLAAAKARAAGASDGASTDPFSPAAPAAGGATAVLETQPQAEEADFDAEEKKKSRPRSGGFVKRLVYALIVLVVVAAGALIVPRQLGLNIPFLSTLEIPFLAELEVPFLGKVFQAAPQDEAGALRIRPVADTVQAEYVENATAGRIVVIRGQVRNEYDHPRSFIKVTAKLYDKNKNVVRAGTVWAGNTLSKEDLASKDMAAIGEQLKNQKGQQNRNVGVKPGMTVPFMVVFDKLPGNLEEYSVEAAGSTK